MKKSGIVLMMTLLMITVLMGITALVLTQSERLLQLGRNAFSQSVSLAVVSDLERQLPALLAIITGPEQLDLAFRLPLQLESKKGDFVLKARLFSPYCRLNINALMNPDGVINQYYVALWMRLFVLHPISNPQILMNLIYDTLDADYVERGIDTEISLIRPDFKNGQIVNEIQFNRILERYIEITRDREVLSIPWNLYIGYNGDKMDFNALNPEMLSLILPGIPPEKIRALTRYRTKAYISKEEAIAAEPALETVFDKYFFIYKSGDSYAVLCDVRLKENMHDEHLTFEYNLLDKKVQRVQFL